MKFTMERINSVIARYERLQNEKGIDFSKEIAEWRAMLIEEKK